MNIQSVIVEESWFGYEDYNTVVFFLEEPVEVVKASIELEPKKEFGETIKRAVFSFEEFIQERTRPLSAFCQPVPE